MLISSGVHSLLNLLRPIAIAALGQVIALAAPPVVKTVPWVASNPLIPHDTWTGKSITLKGTSDVQTGGGTTYEYSWDFGDGTAATPYVSVTNRYALEATHVYTGAVGAIFTAQLRVRNTTTSEAASANYFVTIKAQSLPVEVNRAIDEGLWWLHKTQNRSVANLGNWESGCSFTCSGYYVSTAINTNAFLVNGHKETGDPANPYTETVQRSMKHIFTRLSSYSIGSPANQTNPRGTFNADTNGNGYSVGLAGGPQYPEMYQLGQFIDAVIATGTPSAVTTTGEAPAGANPGILGRTYASIVQDMVDRYAYCQSDGGTLGGAWDYSCRISSTGNDNSTSQWAAIGLLPAQRSFGFPAPPAVKLWNSDWTTNSQLSNGTYVYRDSSFAPIWGPFATTPSGMVQLAYNGRGRGDLQWTRAETYIRDNFASTGNATVNIKAYYYGLFSFVKAMLLHDSNNDGLAEPLTLLQSTTAGSTPIDWYAAQAPTAGGTDPTNGVARTLVNDQNVAGYWTGQSYSSDQFPFLTAYAIIMLNQTIVEPGAPVAVAVCSPNPAVAFQTITCSGANSFHQDAARQIVKWEWDLDNNGTFEVSGVTAPVSFPAVGTYPVRLRVTDDAASAATNTTSLNILVSTPPLAPTAEAGGPYSFCVSRTPWVLDGSGSTNPDQGLSEPGQPPNTIIEYSWDLPPGGSFGDAFGVQPDVTGYFSALGTGSYLIQLRVTDNTAASYPSSGQPNLTSTDSAQIVVRPAGDPLCACVTILATPRPTQVQLRWIAGNPPGGYKILRATSQAGPFTTLATVPGNNNAYLATGLTNGTTYYFRVQELNLNGTAKCDSNLPSATPTGR
ncbi:MAG: PKD domain-containing protein [Bryobacteraceae bacterium]